MEKTAYFYKIEFYDKVNHAKYSMTKEKFGEIFSKIDGYNTSSTPFTYSLKDDSDKTLIEILNINENYLYGRIGKSEDLKYLHFRNRKNHDCKGIETPENFYAEKFTYFYINLDTCILVHLLINGAPRFRKLEKFLNQLYADSKFEVSIIQVSNVNVIDLLKRKKCTVSNVSIKTSVPTDALLGYEGLGLSANDFISLGNVDHISLQCNISAKRNKYFTDKSENVTLEKILEKLHLKKRSGEVEDVKVKVKKPNQRTKEYDLFEDYFTYQIKLPEVNDDTLFTNEMQDLLVNAYEENVCEIMQLAR